MNKKKGYLTNILSYEFGHVYDRPEKTIEVKVECIPASKYGSREGYYLAFIYHDRRFVLDFKGGESMNVSEDIISGATPVVMFMDPTKLDAYDPKSGVMTPFHGTFAFEETDYLLLKGLLV